MKNALMIDGSFGALILSYGDGATWQSVSTNDDTLVEVLADLPPLASFEAYYVSVGPGSFTGIKLAVGMGLAIQAASAPGSVKGVTSFCEYAKAKLQDREAILLGATQTQGVIAYGSGGRVLCEAFYLNQSHREQMQEWKKVTVVGKHRYPLGKVEAEYMDEATFCQKVTQFIQDEDLSQWQHYDLVPQYYRLSSAEQNVRRRSTETEKA